MDKGIRLILAPKSRSVFPSDMKKMMELTNQEEGGELVSKSKQTFKIKIKKNFFFKDHITNL